MITITLEVPNTQFREYKKVFTSFIKEYSVSDLKKIQERNNLYKKLNNNDLTEESNKMSLNETNEYLDKLF